MSNTKAIIFDVDGTVAIRNTGPGGRGPFDWDRVGEDLPNEKVLFVARMLAFASYAAGRGEILFFSGRDECCREQTEMWLAHHFGYHFELFMRPAGDNRPDYVIKEEMLQDVLPRWDVTAVFDDRNQVVDMWRSQGLTCFQVCSREDGDF